MKRILLILVVFAVVASSTFGQTAITGVTPKDARSMGMGGTFRVFSDGYSSFFGNPAGFAAQGSLTLADISTWAYIKPTASTINDVQSLINGSLSDSELLTMLGTMIGQNGFGAGTSVGLGWAGKGFALGANVILDAPIGGAFPLGTKVPAVSQADGVLGFGIPIKLGVVGLKIGLDGRVFYRLNAPSSGWTFIDIATGLMGGGSTDTLLQSLKLYGGYGFAADAGAVLNVGPVLFGFSVRDLGLAFKMKEISVYDLTTGGFNAIPFNGKLPFTLTPQYAAGVGIRLFENGLFEPSVYAEVDDPIYLVSHISSFTTDIFMKLHAGAQLRLLRFLTVRGGLNKGWISVGAGIDLALLEIDAAVFTEEMGLYPGNKGRTGISVQAAIRFGR
jgi:hypothetical protein